MNKRLLLTRNIVRGLKTQADKATANYCLDLIRKHDYENYLCTLLLPRDVKMTAVAIRAFNVEVANVGDQARERNIAAMRLQFWRDGIESIYRDQPPRNPVCLELHRALQRCKLSKRHLNRLIDARSQKLRNPTFPDITSMESYAEETVSAIYYLLLEACGVKSAELEHVAEHLGKSHGLATLIRSIPYQSRRRVLSLPRDAMVKHGVSDESVFRQQSTEKLQNCIFEIATVSKQHLETAESLKRKAKEKTGRIVFLPIVCVRNYLGGLEKADFDVFNAKLQRRDNLLPLKLLWKRLWV